MKSEEVTDNLALLDLQLEVLNDLIGDEDFYPGYEVIPTAIQHIKEQDAALRQYSGVGGQQFAEIARLKGKIVGLIAATDATDDIIKEQEERIAEQDVKISCDNSLIKQQSGLINKYLDEILDLEQKLNIHIDGIRELEITIQKANKRIAELEEELKGWDDKWDDYVADHESNLVDLAYEIGRDREQARREH